MKKKLLVIMMIIALQAHAQVIQVASTTISGNGDALANDFLVPVGVNGPIVFVQKLCNIGPFVPGWNGNDYGTFCFAHAVEQGGLPMHKASSEFGSRAMINGENTNAVRIKWKNTGHNFVITEGYFAQSQSTLDFSVNMAVSGLPAGIPVTVYWQYNIFGSGSTSHEAGFEDYMTVTNSMSVNGISQLGNRFNFASPGGLAGWNEWKNKTGTFRAISGTNFSFNVSSFIALTLHTPGIPGWGGYESDKNDGIFRGEIVFSVLPQFPAVVNNIADSNALFLFSIDIGSDSELSDPQMNGNELFDPGDLYPKVNIPTPMPYPYKNDTSIFGHDPNPKPFSPVNPAPVGSGLALADVAQFYFDLDGSDLISATLTGMSYGPGLPSIPWFNDSCIFEAEYLFVSFDDDTPELYTAVSPPSIPINSSSAMMNVIYADSGRQNEVMEYDFDPMPASGTYFQDELYNESDLHINLTPYPLGNDFADDDVDALDIIPLSGSYTPCSQWYFSADHEAVYNHHNLPPLFLLDPATIYLATSSGPVPVITVLHTGLADGTDINDFEFVWIWDTLSLPPRYGLAILFTVDLNDPMTAVDESGGLDPLMIYYSFLNGTSQLFSTYQFNDHIDGLTVWKNSLNGAQAFPNPIWGTKTWTGSDNENWNNAMNWFPQGIPFDPEDVIIPAVKTGIPYPVVTSNGLDCEDMFISKSAILIIKTGCSITASGSITLEGP